MEILKLSSNQFDKFALQHKYRNYYQTSMYANVMSKFDYKTQYLGFVNDENKLIGATLILIKNIIMGNKIAFAPRGMLINYENSDSVNEIISNLKKYLSKQGIIYFKMDPYIPLTIRDTTGTIINFNNKENDIINNIQKNGFKYKGKTLFFETENPRWEALVLLKRDTTEIFSKLDKRTRNKIRKANNNGVEIIKDKSKNVKKFYKFINSKEEEPINFYEELIKNFGDNIEIYYAKLNTETYSISSRRNYKKELDYNETISEKIQNMQLDEKEREEYINKKMESDKLITNYKNNLLKSTELLKNNPEGIIIGATMVIKFDNAAFIYAEGSNNKFRSLNANYLMKWQLINEYNSLGFKYLNLNAIVGDFENQNEFSGLNETKLGFNTTITEYVGEFEIILNSFAYKLYETLNKKK